MLLLLAEETGAVLMYGSQVQRQCRRLCEHEAEMWISVPGFQRRRASQRVNATETDDLFRAFNISAEKTGLRHTVWVFTAGDAGALPFVKVSTTPTALPTDMISVAVGPPVEVLNGLVSDADLNALCRWLNLNRGVILRYWEGNIYAEDALNALQSVRA